MSLDMLKKCQLVPVRIPSLFQQNVFKAVGRTLIEGSCKVYAGKTNWKTSWKLYPLSLASKKWGALEAPWQMTPIRAALTCCKACDSVGEDDFALLVSIPNRWWSDMNPIRSNVSFEHEVPGADILLLISAPNASHFEPNLFLLSRMRGSDMLIPTFSVEKLGVTGVISLDMSKRSHVVRVRSPRLLEHDFLKAVCRTEISEIERSCKVYAVKDQLENKLKAVPFEPFKQEVRSNWSTLADDSYSSSIYLFQSMSQYCRRCVLRC